MINVLITVHNPLNILSFFFFRTQIFSYTILLLLWFSSLYFSQFLLPFLQDPHTFCFSLETSRHLRNINKIKYTNKLEYSKITKQEKKPKKKAQWMHTDAERPCSTQESHKSLKTGSHNISNISLKDLQGRKKKFQFTIMRQRTSLQRCCWAWFVLSSARHVAYP